VTPSLPPSWPQPPGFIISTATCLQYFAYEPDLPFGLVEEYMAAIKVIEGQTGKVFGSPQNPLLFSVRSGAAISMPGMLDTGKPLPLFLPSSLFPLPPFLPPSHC